MLLVQTITIKKKENTMKKRILSALTVFAAICFTMFFGFVSPQVCGAETIIAAQTISTNTTWTLANSPYTVTGSVTVSEDAALTINQRLK
jgi:hypothetical protein